MSRDELLTKLAMELAEWPEHVGGAHGPAFFIPSSQYYGSAHPDNFVTTQGFTKNAWLKRRAELINEPDDADAPEWARCVAQNANGDWWAFEVTPTQWMATWGVYSRRYMMIFKGAIPAGHDWRATLRGVNRDMSRNDTKYDPRDVAFNRELNPSTSSLTNSEARQVSEETQICSDGYPCDETPCSECPNQDHAQPRTTFEVSTPEEEAEFRRIEAERALSNGQLEHDIGMKYDGDKLMADLLFDMPLALTEVIDVLTQGAEKYAPGNWAHVNHAERRYKAASMRHELALASGEARDDETGCHHLAHKICCDMFRLELALRKGRDND